MRTVSCEEKDYSFAVLKFQWLWIAYRPKLALIYIFSGEWIFEWGLENKSNFSEILQLRCFCGCCHGVATLSFEQVFQKRKVLMVRLQQLCGLETQKQSQENPYVFNTLFPWEVLAQSGSLIKIMKNRNKRMRISYMSNDEDIGTKYLFSRAWLIQPASLSGIILKNLCVFVCLTFEGWGLS